MQPPPVNSPHPPPYTPTGWWRPSTKGKRIALLIATLWPLLYIGLFFIGVFLMAGTMKDAPHGPPGEMPPMFVAMFAGHCVTMLVAFALLGVYIVSVVRNPRLDSTMRIIWVLLMFFGSFFAMAVYWFLYLWSDAPDAPRANA